MSRIVVAALYRFVSLDNFTELRQPLLKQMLKNNIKGTLLLAREGINGTVAGTQSSIASTGLAQSPGYVRTVTARPTMRVPSPLPRCRESVKR